jgi:hypothetical protein
MENAADEVPRPLRLNESQFATVVRAATLAIVVTGVPTFVVGAIDFLGGRTIDARILGALNLAAAATWFATAAGFRYRTIVFLGIVLAGGLLAIGYGIYYGFQWWRFGQTNQGLALLTGWMLMLALMILLILLGLWRRYEITDHTKRRFAAGRFGIPVVAVLGVLGALFQSWYSAAYGPSALPPNLVVAAQLTPVGEQVASGARAYSVDIDVSNVGQSRVQVLASWYNLTTLQTIATASETPYAQSVADSFDNEPFVLSTQPHRAGRLMTLSEPIPIGAGELLTRGWWFEPGESSHLQFLAFVDPKGADVLHLGMGLNIARGNRLELSAEKGSFECPTQFEPVDTMVWTSSEPSAVRSLTAPRLEMVYGWETAENGALGFETCYGVNDTWYSATSRDPMLEIMSEEYGLVTTYAETQVSLWPAPAEVAP